MVVHIETLTQFNMWEIIIKYYLIPLQETNLIPSNLCCTCQDLKHLFCCLCVYIYIYIYIYIRFKNTI
jgi:hypothetical protein